MYNPAMLQPGNTFFQKFAIFLKKKLGDPNFEVNLSFILIPSSVFPWCGTKQLSKGALFNSGGPSIDF